MATDFHIKNLVLGIGMNKEDICPECCLLHDGGICYYDELEFPTLRIPLSCPHCFAYIARLAKAGHPYTFDNGLFVVREKEQKTC